VAFARLLLHKPRWVFMDEATSALDESMEASLMGLFRDELAGTTLISIAHRPAVEAFHDRTLSLIKSATGARLVTKRPRSQKQNLPRKPSLSNKLLQSLAVRSGRKSK
jgi:putative ATP-binding cassette transporter